MSISVPEMKLKESWKVRIWQKSGYVEENLVIYKYCSLQVECVLANQYFSLCMYLHNCIYLVVGYRN